MKTRTWLSFMTYTVILLVSLSVGPVYALPSEAMIQCYNQAAQGDEKLVEPLYTDLENLLAQEGASALSLVYLGSTRTLMGRDAFLPWKKMRYSEEGLAMIDKGLTLLSSHTNTSSEHTAHSEEHRSGLPTQMLAIAVAAATYTAMPDIFNHFERGYDLYLNLLADPQFQTQPFASSAWIYRLAIVAALRGKDEEQAQLWLKTMQQAQALLSQG